MSPLQGNWDGRGCRADAQHFAIGMNGNNGRDQGSKRHNVYNHVGDPGGTLSVFRAPTTPPFYTEMLRMLMVGIYLRNGQETEAFFTKSAGMLRGTRTDCGAGTALSSDRREYLERIRTNS